MNSFEKIMESVASEAFTAVGNIASHHAGKAWIEGQCDRIGWSLDKHVGGGAMGLHFNDPLIGRRTVRIDVGQDGATTRFTVDSAARMANGDVTPQLLSALLQRNKDGFAAWRLTVCNGQNVAFSLRYVALTLGLQTGIFKMICESMAAESHVFDKLMLEAGFLG